MYNIITVTRPVYANITRRHADVGAIDYALHDVNGHRLDVFGSADVVVQLGDATYHHTFIVSKIPTHGILGQYFLMRFVSKIDYRRSVLQTDQAEIQCWIGGEAALVCRVEVADTVVLPPQSRMCVPVSVPHAERLAPCGYIEPSLDEMAAHENMHGPGSHRHSC